MGGHRRVRARAAIPSRSRDPAARDARARRARGRAAVPARRHRDRRAPRDAAARRAGDRRDGPHDARLAVHLPDLRDDRAGRPAVTARATTRAPASSPRSRCGWRARSALALALVCVAARRPARRARSAARGETAALAARYLRISALGLLPALVALAGQGYLRGIADLRTPLVIVVAAQVANVVLEVWFVYGLDWGLDGSAAGTVIAQAGMGARVRLAAAAPARAAASARAPRRALLAPLVRISGELFVRSAALLVAFATASAVLARIGETLARRAPDRDRAVHASARSCSTRSRSPRRCSSAARSARGDAAGARGGGAAHDRLVARRGLRASARCCWRSPASLPHAFTDDPAVIERAPRDLADARAHAARGGGRLRARRDPHRRRRHALPRRLDAARGRRASTSRSRCSRSRWTGASTGVWAGLLAFVGARLVTLGCALRRAGAGRSPARRSRATARAAPGLTVRAPRPDPATESVETESAIRLWIASSVSKSAVSAWRYSMPRPASSAASAST